MSKFFKVEEFAQCFDHSELAQRNCDYANAKLQSEGIIVYGWDTTNPSVDRFYQDRKHPVLGAEPRIKALLINIEPIEKCKHPPDRVIKENWLPTIQHFHSYTCTECGVKVKPKEFEEVK